MKNRKENILVMTFVLLIAVAFAGSASAQNRLDPTIGFDPSLQQPLVYRQDDGTLLNTSGEPGEFQLSITRPGRQPVVITLPEDVDQINSIDPAPGDKAVLIGMASGLVYTVVIVDTLNPHIVDHFWAFRPVLSPNGQFITFIKFYTPHFVQGTSDHVLLYDVTSSAESNRPRGISLDDDTNVGSPVYPPNIQTTDPNTELPEAAIIHVPSETFFWASDSSKFVFAAERLLPENRNAPVEINANSPKVEVSLVVVNPSHEKIAVRTLPAMTCETSAGSCEHQLYDVEFGDDGVKAQFRGFSSKAGQKQSLQAKYNQFRSR